MGTGTHSLSNLIAPGMQNGKDPRTVVAAYGLLTLAESAIPLQPSMVGLEQRGFSFWRATSNAVA